MQGNNTRTFRHGEYGAEVGPLGECPGLRTAVAPSQVEMVPGPDLDPHPGSPVSQALLRPKRLLEPLVIGKRPTAARHRRGHPSGTEHGTLAADRMHIPTFLAQAPGPLGITTGRFVVPAEIASAVVFLLSDAAATSPAPTTWSTVACSRPYKDLPPFRQPRQPLATGPGAVVRPLSSTMTSSRPWAYH